MNKLFLVHLGIILSSVMVLSRLLDFLIGNRGRKWIKSKIIFYSWFYLESLSIIAIFRVAASFLEKLFLYIFGKKILSLRAAATSIIISLVVITAAVVNYFPGIINFVEGTYTIQEGLIVRILSIFVMILYICSYSITRYLIRIIARVRKIHHALLLWICDLLSLLLLTLCAFYTTKSAFEYFIPGKENIIILFGFKRIVYEFAWSIVLIASPTIIHMLFAIIATILFIVEFAKRIMCIVLERFDESNESPITIIASFCMILGILVRAFILVFD